MAVSVVDEAEVRHEVGNLSLSATPMSKHSMFMDLNRPWWVSAVIRSSGSSLG